jgi:hypothetical protein
MGRKRFFQMLSLHWHEDSPLQQLSSSMALANFMRFSLMKAAQAVAGGASFVGFYGHRDFIYFQL